jgi:hypothetical protein
MTIRQGKKYFEIIVERLDCCCCSINVANLFWSLDRRLFINDEVVLKSLDGEDITGVIEEVVLIAEFPGWRIDLL